MTNIWWWILSLCTAVAKPGVPQIKLATHTYSLLNDKVQSYSSSVQGVYDNVTLNLEWEVSSGSDGERVQFLWDDHVVKNGTDLDLSSKKISHEVSTSGVARAAVRLCDSHGCSDSDSVYVLVTDTDDLHLSNEKQKIVLLGKSYKTYLCPLKNAIIYAVEAVCA
uniref:Chitinase A N-terminal domain-containing protein n=1 Tax=Cryptophlebia leucotreta granulosis virus TaxID=35254 RepID=A0A2H4ZKF3_GVCL|nr:hypothetical protein [Cryptophlebia leucotreta granulovirus]